MAGSDPNAPASNSASGLVSTLIPNFIIACVFLSIFLALRVTYKRIYQPRTYLGTLSEHQRSPRTSNSKFGWVRQFLSVPDEYVLNHHSIDGYLYLRFYRTILFICLVGWPLTWAVLMPVYGTSHAVPAQMQFDKISYSNISATQDATRLYATVFVGWVFFGFVMWVIGRESIHYIQVKQALMLLPGMSSRLSSRTVLFTNVPTEFINEVKLRETFRSIKHVWLPTDTKKLDELVEERDKTALKLEASEIKLSKTANDKRIKTEKKSGKQANEDPLHWLTQKDRPTHRLGKFGLYGKKVDTIDWSRSHLTEMGTVISSERDIHLTGKGKWASGVFIEFETVQAAQSALHKQHIKLPKGFVPRASGTRPQEIIWKNLSMGASQNRIRNAVAVAIIFAMIIMWLPITAFIGAVSNINNLYSLAPWLKFIQKLGPAVGIITGFLPTIALAVALILVPIIMRVLFKLAGAVTTAEVELKTQTWYFVFQVIQVFLVPTLGSGAVSSVQSIIQKPGDAPALLAHGLPKASNFYINYIVLFGLIGSAKALCNIGALIVYILLGKLLDKTPRKKYNRYLNLSGLQWGSVFPVYTNIACIVIIYSCISPLILGFAAVAMFLIYFAFRYNMIYTQDTLSMNTQGRAYAKALQQLTTGVYIAEVCLIGLFAIVTASSTMATGPLVLMIVFLVFTAVFHFLLNRTLASLEKNLAHDSEAMMTPQNGEHSTALKEGGTATQARLTSAGVNNKMTNLFVKILVPPRLPTFETFLSTTLPEYAPEIRREAYLNPAIWKPQPQLWIVRDEMGISAREKAESSKVAQISDDGAWFDEKGKVQTLLSASEEKADTNLATQAPIWQDHVHY